MPFDTQWSIALSQPRRNGERPAIRRPKTLAFGLRGVVASWRGIAQRMKILVSCFLSFLVIEAVRTDALMSRYAREIKATSKAWDGLCFPRVRTSRLVAENSIDAHSDAGSTCH